tara:strand:+ start:353 stop:826 length:474 start_codon:yes stop_codon:yes gene_type:complete
MKNFTKFFVSLFYIGYFKYASGTIGTLLSIIILYPYFKYINFSLSLKIAILIFIIIISLFLINIFSKHTKSHDSKIIVIDEFIGVYFIFLFYENIFIINDILSLFLIFFLFRFFDITKIFPANLIDKKFKNAFGVILDDIIAAIYTILTFYFINVTF